jgi:hypothetical protein
LRVRRRSEAVRECMCDIRVKLLVRGFGGEAISGCDGWVECGCKGEGGCLVMADSCDIEGDGSRRLRRRLGKSRPPRNCFNNAKAPKHPATTPTIPLLLTLHSCILQYGSPSSKWRQRKCCIQGKRRIAEAWKPSANPGCRTRRSPELYGARTLLLQEVWEL